MANEKRLIDVNPLMKDGWHLVKTGKSNVFIASMSLADVQTVDAVEVVRCRECEHHRDKNEREQQYLVEDILICTSPDVTDDCWNAVWPDHFCSYGERKGGDGNG